MGNSSELRRLFQKNLEDLYGVFETGYRDYELSSLIELTVVQEQWLFIPANAICAKWHPYFNKKNYTHRFLLTQYNSTNTSGSVIDFIPEYNGEHSYEEIEAAYLSSNSRECFTLSKPTQAPGFYLTENQVKSVYLRLTNQHTQSHGINGLVRFQNDLLEAEQIGKEILNHWWGDLLFVINARESFLEFMWFLNRNTESPYYSLIQPSLLDIIERIINEWVIFRNSIMKLRISERAVDHQQLAEKIGQIIQLESFFAKELKACFAIT
ncbi:hypothetical protein BC351_39065 [Paenibacillus ferrarius]|uniref:Uncharacterized protein n=1 Tax=Paenibacillus ferrarius TaxID=1469647 RepID=A0A1V4H9Q1_9BACL|nr:hypothetical protein BC351_39065 [Paenibacillus ferrarius]